MRLKIYKSNLRKNSQFNNKGFTLVELIVSIAIFAIVGVAIAAFFSVAMTQYRTNTNETNIQTESQMTWKRLESNILIANQGIWIPRDTQIDLYKHDDDKNAVHKYLMTSIYYDNSTGKNSIYYQDYYYDEEKKQWVKDGDAQLFASLVTSFKIEMFDKDGNKITEPSTMTRPAKVEAHISYDANGRTYDSVNDVALRNSVVATYDFADIYANVTKK